MTRAWVEGEHDMSLESRLLCPNSSQRAKCCGKNRCFQNPLARVAFRLRTSWTVVDPGISKGSPKQSATVVSFRRTPDPSPHIYTHSTCRFLIATENLYHHPSRALYIRSSVYLSSPVWHVRFFIRYVIYVSLHMTLFFKI